MGFTPITVRVGAGLQYATGERARGRVKLTPSAPMRNGTTVVAATVTQEVGRDGLLPLPVAATDDPDTLPPDVTYLVELTIPGQAPRKFYAVVPHTAPGGIVDLDDVDELTEPPALVAPLRRIATADDLDLDLNMAQVGQALVIISLDPLTFGFVGAAPVTPSDGDPFPATYTATY